MPAWQMRELRPERYTCLGAQFQPRGLQLLSLLLCLWLSPADSAGQNLALLSGQARV